ncbi:MAG: heat-inducible transcription repressor HrcA [Chloroflexi bacterium]|nr:heat-inducible transcription repressor HrcA [Chloroflexota bacterium]
MATSKDNLTTGRRLSLLNVLVDEYIHSAVPVGSLHLARYSGLGVSPATVRNDMAALEEAGYLTRPHISAGAVPSTKAYRLYVAAVEFSAPQLNPADRQAVADYFKRLAGGLDEWLHAASDLLSRLVNNAAFTTSPKTARPILRHLQLVWVREKEVLLVAVLPEAKLRQQMLRLPTPASQDQLTFVSNRLNSLFAGLSAAQIEAKATLQSALERQVMTKVVEGLRAEEADMEQGIDVMGIRFLMAQPEFSESEKLRPVVDVLEKRQGLRRLVPNDLYEEGFAIIIGDEHTDASMRACSVVMARYGVGSEASGVVSVLGPTRMRYERAIAAVRYLAAVLGEFLQNGPPRPATRN